MLTLFDFKNHILSTERSQNRRDVALRRKYNAWKRAEGRLLCGGGGKLRTFEGKDYVKPTFESITKYELNTGGDLSTGDTFFQMPHRHEVDPLPTWTPNPSEFLTYHCVKFDKLPLLISGQVGQTLFTKNIIYTYTNPNWQWKRLPEQTTTNQCLELRIPEGVHIGVTSTQTWKDKHNLFAQDTEDRDGHEVLLPPSNWQITGIMDPVDIHMQQPVNIERIKDHPDLTLDEETEWVNYYTVEEGKSPLPLIQPIKTNVHKYVKYSTQHDTIQVYKKYAKKIIMEWTGYYIPTSETFHGQLSSNRQDVLKQVTCERQ